jgi:O-antigen/teichoic acid export membrane protein
MFKDRFKQWLHDLSFVVAPKIMGGAGTFILNILMLHSFRPEQYGVYSLCAAAIVLMDGILGAAVDLGVVRLTPVLKSNNPARGQAIQQIALYIKAAVIAILFLLLFFYAAAIRHYLFSDKGEIAWLYWTNAAILGVLLLRSVQTHYQVNGKFRAYGKLEIFHITIKFSAIYLMLAFGYANPGFIMAAFAAAPLCIVIFFFCISGRSYFCGRENISISLFRELFHYVKWFLVTNSISVVIVYLPAFALSQWAGMKEVGIYSAGQTLSSIFPMLGAYIAILVSPKIVQYCSEGRFYTFFRASQKLLISGTIVVYLFLLLGFDYIAQKLLPTSYSVSRHVFMILLPSALSWLVSTPLIINFILFVRPKFLLIVESVSFPILLLSYLVIVPSHGAIGAAWVTMIAGLVRSIILQLAAWKWARQAPLENGWALANPQTSAF